MVTYEGIKLAAEVVAFASITGIVYVLSTFRAMIRELLGTSTARWIWAGVLIFWLGYLTNVLNDVFPFEFMKVLDDVIVAIGMVVMAFSLVGVSRQIRMGVEPSVVLNGESKLQRGAYMVKPASPGRILSLLSGKKVLAVTRSPHAYEVLNVPYIWITNLDHPRAISPTRLAPLLHSVINSVDEDAFVVLDGIDYLVLHNGFEPTFKFLLSLKDALLERGAGVLLVVDPEALEKRQLAMLEREFSWIKG